MKKIKDIKKGLLKRNASLLKYAVKTGLNVIQNRDDPKKMIENIVGVNPLQFVDELSHYKGSITKAGQMLSQYGEYYLPAKVNEKLRLLHGSTHYLPFEKIKEQLCEESFQNFQINEEPIAAASIGQVHLAVEEKTKKRYVFKIQYDGISKAISNDLAFIKLFTSSLKILPKGVDTSEIFTEIEKVLKQEMDYIREAEVLSSYKEKINDDYFYVPEVLNQYSNQKSICLEYIEGFPVSDIDRTVTAQEKLNKLGEKIFELFLREIFEFHLVQTDAHGGNYFVNEDVDKLYLLDFGACLEFDDKVLKYYQNFLKYSYMNNKGAFLKEFKDFIKFTGKSLEFNEDVMWDYMLLASSPLRSQRFNWGATKLPDELFILGKKLQSSMKFNSIPSDFIFLDRKVIGVFTLLKRIGASFDVERVFNEIAFKK